jgi:hypothetical protein
MAKDSTKKSKKSKKAAKKTDDSMKKDQANDSMKH